MERPERSSYVFTIAEEVGIPLGPGEKDMFGDEIFLTFCDRYRIWSKSRDIALNAYLTRTPTLFRCYLPYSQRVFQIAYQTLWYLDEIIIKDPIEQLLDRPGVGDYKNLKANLAKTFQVLNYFKQSIESGYLLLAGSNLIPKMEDNPPVFVQELLMRRDLTSELDKAVRFGLDRRLDNQKREWILFSAQLDSGAILGWHKEGTISTGAAPAIKIGELLPMYSYTELSSSLKRDIYEEVRNLYPREVHSTLHSVSLATSLNAAILFDRQADSAIISIAGSPTTDPKRQELTVGSINLLLPYLEGVPADRLLELRGIVPDAFYEFRANIADIVSRAMKEDPEKAPEIARLAAERELVPSVHKLQLEMEAASRKARILGYGLPIISATGALVGSCAGAGIMQILPIFLVGAGAAVKAAAESYAERKRAQINPFYFLWRAKYS
jgi:hypothetical protein